MPYPRLPGARLDNEKGTLKIFPGNFGNGDGERKNFPVIPYRIATYNERFFLRFYYKTIIFSTMVHFQVCSLEK
jgi:hypothetical protein